MQQMVDAIFQTNLIQKQIETKSETQEMDEQREEMRVMNSFKLAASPFCEMFEGRDKLTQLESELSLSEPDIATMSRRTHIRQLGKTLGKFYGCLEASSRLEVGWLGEVLQADIPPLIDALNAQGGALGFRVNRSGDWLSLDFLEHDET